MSRLIEQEIVLALDMFDQGKSRTDIARALGRSVNAVDHIIRKFHPSTRLAEKYIRANALKLAEKVVKFSNVEEAIDVLTRPNIGVLQPVVSKHAVGFFSSVDPSTLGAVQSVDAALPRPVGEGVTDAVRTGRPLPDGAPRSPLGLPGQQGSGSEEHEVGGDPYTSGVRQGQEGREHAASRVVSCYEFEEPPTVPTKQARPDGRHGAQQHSRSAPRSRRELHIVDPHPPKVAIKREYRNPKAHGDSGIHLRYDVVEPD